MAHAIIILPQGDFDPTEVAVPWSALTQAGHHVSFATMVGGLAECDAITLTGDRLPRHAKSLAARPENRKLYEEMAASQEFRAPISWAAVTPSDYQLFFFPGGHGQRMRSYLESPIVQSIALAAFAADKLVGAICHGVIPLARARTKDGVSPLLGRKTTALPNMMESIAIRLTKSALGHHYRTYQQSVEAEVTAALANKKDFMRGPMIPRFATQTAPDKGFVVRDQNYVSARWPGDAWTLASTLVGMLNDIKPA